MPVFFLLGLTILVLVIAVWATVVEEDEITTMMDESAPEQEPEPYEEPYLSESELGVPTSCVMGYR